MEVLCFFRRTFQRPCKRQDAVRSMQRTLTMKTRQLWISREEEYDSDDDTPDDVKGNGDNDGACSS